MAPSQDVEFEQKYAFMFSPPKGSTAKFGTEVCAIGPVRMPVGTDRRVNVGTDLVAVPDQLRDPDCTLSTFRQSLKTFFFNQY